MHPGCHSVVLAVQTESVLVFLLIFTLKKCHKFTKLPKVIDAAGKLFSMQPSYSRGLLQEMTAERKEVIFSILDDTY